LVVEVPLAVVLPNGSSEYSVWIEPLPSASATLLPDEQVRTELPPSRERELRKDEGWVSGDRRGWLQRALQWAVI
jgi:hypothetical protein